VSHRSNRPPVKLTPLAVADRERLMTITARHADYLADRHRAAVGLVAATDRIHTWTVLGVEPPEAVRHELQQKITEWEGFRWTPFRRRTT
jgi:hypothetical protein